MKLMLSLMVVGLVCALTYTLSHTHAAATGFDTTIVQLSLFHRATEVFTLSNCVDLSSKRADELCENLFSFFTFACIRNTHVVLYHFSAIILNQTQNKNNS